MKLKDIKSEDVLAEFVGTFGLTLAVLAALSGPIIGLPVSIIGGIAVGFFVLTIGAISGCHINPAITLGQYTIGKINALAALSYVVAQLSGALLALVVFGLFNDNQIYELGGLETWSTFWAEVLGTAVLGFAVTAAVMKKSDSMTSALTVGGGLVVGGALASIGSYSVLNPAVAVGVGAAGWPYAAGPVVGAIIGSHVYKLLTPATKAKASKK